MATGTAGREQLSKLPELLQTAREQGLFRVVYLHHCPIAGQDKWRKRLTDADRVQALLEEHGAELALHGHGHRKHYKELDTRDGKLPVIAVPSASALGLHGRDIAHYNQYQVQRSTSGWQLRIDSRRYQPDSGEFVAGDSRAVELERHM